MNESFLTLLYLTECFCFQLFTNTELQQNSNATKLLTSGVAAAAAAANINGGRSLHSRGGGNANAAAAAAAAASPSPGGLSAAAAAAAAAASAAAASTKALLPPPSPPPLYSVGNLNAIRQLAAAGIAQDLRHLGSPNATEMSGAALAHFS